MTIAVYRYEVYDKETRSWSVQPYRATKEHITSLGGAPHFGTKLMVPESMVIQGIYRPPWGGTEG